MFAAGKTAAVSGSAPDAQFNYVTMLLHGDGTNGAQNNTFLDSSTNNFTITRNGNTTQGSFSPYGSNWSNNFNGSSSITAPDSSAFDYGSGDFTLECWIFPTTTNSSTLLTAQTSGGIYGPCNLFFNSGALELYSSSNGSSFDVASGASVGTPTVNQWSHVAVSRSGTSIRCFLNGTLTSTTTSSATLMNATGTFQIASRNGGEFYSGYVSNFRVVKGTAVYTSAFTPSTTPLTAISGTSLLTCADNRFVDDSTNNFAITVNGTPSVQRFNPFGASTAYDTSVIGGSGYFDGTGDYLSVPTGTALNLSTGDFTIEGWMYATDVIGYHTIFSNGDYPSTAQVILVVAAAPSLYMSNGSGWVITLSSSINVNINSWNHIAVTASGTTYTIWVNGVSGGSSTASFTRTTPASTSVVGRLYVSTDDYYAKGYTTNVRVVKGTALYTTTFTPPTAPLTAVSGTSLLLNTLNAGIFDNAMMNDLETVGNAQISTSVKKYGTGSLAFDGTGDRLVGPATPNMAFGTGDYTIEFWCYPSNTGYGCFIDTRSANPSTDGVSIFNNGTDLEVYSSTLILSASGAFTLNTWQFFALTRSGTSLKAFVNGTQVGSTATNSDNQTAGRVMIGDNVGVAYPLNGYIDDLRITKGYARYTANFTAPTAAFSDTGPY